MSETDQLPERELAEGEQPDFPVGTLKIGETEHCCHEVAIRRLSIFERSDGSRRQVWDMIAEFRDRGDAELCLAKLSSVTEVEMADCTFSDCNQYNPQREYPGSYGAQHKDS